MYDLRHIPQLKAVGSSGEWTSGTAELKPTPVKISVKTTTGAPQALSSGQSLHLHRLSTLLALGPAADDVNSTSP